MDAERLDQIADLLERDDSDTVVTSIRVPAALRDAAALAVKHLGAAHSTNALVVAGLRQRIESALMEAALDAHYERHPDARPDLVEVTLAAARQDDDPLADEPGLIRRAAEQIVRERPDADADDVLLWARAQQQAGTPR